MRKNHERIKEQMERYHSDDVAVKQQAINEIVEDYSKFITHLINKHFSTYISKYFEDMFSSGMIGLLYALTKYNPEKSMPTTFFATYIIHDIYEFIAKFVGNTTPHYAMKIALLNRAKNELEGEGNHNPSVIDLAMRTGLKPELVIKSLAIKEAARTQSFDCEEFFFDNIEADPLLQPETIAIDKEGKNIIFRSVCALPDNMREVVMRKLGMGGYLPQNNEQISFETGIKARQVRSLYSKALERLRESDIYSFFASQYKTPARCPKEMVALIPEDTAERMISALLEYDSVPDEAQEK